MTRPAKPPMTLKEAKRAYKKEGNIVRYTASQMARADRIDAKEEKRKKELEKERQRAENKRKREEKEDRDRRVRQKMLDEGRINLEDTWGKVTASQPRLNKFFGRKPAVGPSKSSLRAEFTADKEKPNSRDGSAAGSQDKEDTAPEIQDAPQQDMPAAVSKIAPHTTPSHQETAPDDIRHGAASRPIRREFFSSTRSQPSILRALRSSQINARSSAPGRSLRDDKRELSPRTLVDPQTGSNSFNAEITPGTISPRFTRQSPRYMLSSSESNTVSEGSPTELLPEMTTVNQGGQELGHDEILLPGSSQKKEQTATPGGGRPAAPTLDLTDEEDFTDGIDDETFLLLCATQKPAKDSTSISGDSSTKNSNMSTSIGTAPKQEANRAYDAVSPSTDFVASMPHGLSESFNSIFNEFEDEDLIALAEEVEAGNTPKRTPLVTPVVKAEKVTPQPPAHQPGKPPCDFPNQQLARVRQDVPSLPELKAKDIPPPSMWRQGASPNSSLVSKQGAALIPPTRSSRTPFVGGHRQATGSNTRTAGSNPRALGTTLRATGTNPKAVGSTIKTETGQLTQLVEKTKYSPPSPKLLKKRIWPKDMLPVDEFPGLGPSTQALSLELLEQFEAQMRDEVSKLEARLDDNR